MREEIHVRKVQSDGDTQNSTTRVNSANRHQLQLFMQKLKVHLNKTIAVPGSPT
jgi:hypothetical protein